MARPIGNQVPETILPLVSGENLEDHVGLTILALLNTVDDWPHLAMVSVGEVVVVGPREIRLALWPQSTATASLTQSRRVTLALVWEGAAYYLRCSAERLGDMHPSGFHRVAAFRLRVEEAQQDVAPYAELTSGVTFRLKNPDDVLPRWRATVDALRALA